MLVTGILKKPFAPSFNVTNESIQSVSSGSSISCFISHQFQLYMGFGPIFQMLWLMLLALVFTVVQSLLLLQIRFNRLKSFSLSSMLINKYSGCDFSMTLTTLSAGTVHQLSFQPHNHQSVTEVSWNQHCTKNEVSNKGFFSNCDQIGRKLWIWSHLLKNSLVENFIFCAVLNLWVVSLIALLKNHADLSFLKFPYFSALM